MRVTDIEITQKQYDFINADSTEVLFGGAAGGGKSYGQLADALIFALKHPSSKQLILRRTYSELEKSLIRVSLGLYPKEIYTYNSSNHTGRFANGSILDFGYCAGENDVYQYQSAEYDVIRFDELTHFTEFQYLYLISRIRGANGYPKQIKSSTNPGGIGHLWVKKRFVDIGEPQTVYSDANGGTRIFIPSKIDDNTFLMKSDPEYKRRLLALPENQMKALLYGDWNIFEGQYFTEFDYGKHTCKPFEIPKEWRKYRTLDYGLDRLACLWIAVSPQHFVYVYRELCESNLMISTAAEKIRGATPVNEEIYATLAPPDLWSRSQETGRSKANIFEENGVRFTKSSNDREAGWLCIKELLRADANGEARLKIFRSCTEIIKCLPMLQTDTEKPDDTKTEPHEITHAPDALRGFAIFYTRPNPVSVNSVKRRWSEDMWQDYSSASSTEKEYLLKKYGEPL